MPAFNRGNRRRRAGGRAHTLSPQTAQLLHELLNGLRVSIASLHENKSSYVGALPKRSGGGDEELARLSRAVVGAMRHGDRTAAAQACIQLVDWTEEKLELDLAISYARVAIDLDPSSAVAAYKAGRLARRLAIYEEAERLFKAAIERGRAVLDWETVARAYAGLGRSQEQQGEFEDAEASHMRSLATALDHRLRDLQSDGYHSLAVVAFERDKTDEGVAYARKALDACGTRKDRIAQLAHDLAYVWLTRESTPGRVLSIFNEVLQVVKEPVRRLVVLANIAHSYGKLGEPAKFDEIAGHVETLLRATSGFGENHAQALLDLAHGAAALGRDQQARRYAERSQTIAQKRKELFVVEKAADFLQELPRVEPTTNTFGRTGGLFRERRIDDLVYEIMEALR